MSNYCPKIDANMQNALKQCINRLNYDQLSKQVAEGEKARKVDPKLFLGDLFKVIKQKYPNFSFRQFGSRAMSLGNENSDFDIFLEFGPKYSPDQVHELCDMITNNLGNDWEIVNFHTTGRAPLVSMKAKHSMCGIKAGQGVDLVLGNKYGSNSAEYVQQIVNNSQVLLIKKVAFFLRDWLEVLNLPEMHSYYLLVMTICYFQSEVHLPHLAKSHYMAVCIPVLDNKNNLYKYLIGALRYLEKFDFKTKAMTPYCKSGAVSKKDALKEIGFDSGKAEPPMVLRDLFEMDRNLTERVTAETLDNFQGACRYSAFLVGKAPIK